MSRRIILKKEIESGEIEGFFINEYTDNKKQFTEVQQVNVNTKIKKVNYLNKEILKGAFSQELINKYLNEGYYIRKDDITEYNEKKTGFRVINNLSDEIIGSYNWS